MIRTLSTLAVLASVVAMASPAAADVTVQIKGKDMATVEALVKDAAKVACRDELRGSMMSFHLQNACVEAATADAMAKVKAAAPATYAAAPAPLAVTRISN